MKKSSFWNRLSLVAFIVCAFSAATVTANFAVNTYKVTFVAGANGTIDGDKIQTVNYNTDCMTVTAYPNANYKFVNWTGTGGFTTTDTNPLTVTNVTSAMTITANFTHNTADLTVNANGTGTAIFTGVNPVNTVTAIPIAATAAANYHFVNWTVASGSATIAGPTAASTAVTLTGGDASEVTVTANFAVNTNKVTFVAGLNGSILGNKVQTIGYGDNCDSVTAVPNDNYRFKDWTGVATPVVDPENLTVTGVTSTMTITANFAHNTATLTMANDGRGTAKFTGVNPVNTATAIPITATPNASFAFVNWIPDSGNATIANPNSASTTVTLTNDATVTANFQTSTSLTLLTMAKVGTGTVTPLVGASNVAKNAQVEITANPDAGWHFVKWAVTVNPANAAIEDQLLPGTKVTLTGPATVTATFAHDVNNLTMSMLPATGSGTTNPASGTTKPNISTGTLYPITATAATDWHFVNWTLADGSATIANVNVPSTNVTLTGGDGATAIIQAEFAHNTTTLTMAKTGSGTIGGDVVSGPNTVNTNTPVTITATADPGYHFMPWSSTAGPVITDKNSTSTTVKLATPGTVTANFAPDLETITFAAGPHGTVSGTLPQKILFGLSCTPVRATPETGYHFVNWTGPNSFESTSNPVTVAADQANDMEITANFAQNRGTLTVDSAEKRFY